MRTMVGGLLAKPDLCKMALQYAFEEEWTSELFKLLDEQIRINSLVKHATDFDTWRFYNYLSMNVMNKYPTMPWNWNLVCAKSILTINDIRKYPEKLNDWDALSTNTNFSIEDIMDNLDLPWNFDKIYINMDISGKIVIKYSNFNWNWNQLRIYYDAEGMNFISQNIDKPWNWANISRCTDLKYFIKYPELPWNWEFVSTNESITMEFIKQNMDKPWDWNWVANRWCGLAKKHVIDHNIKHILLLTMHEYHNNPTNYSFPMKNVEIILADDYLTKKLLHY